MNDIGIIILFHTNLIININKHNLENIVIQNEVESERLYNYNSPITKAKRKAIYFYIQIQILDRLAGQGAMSAEKYLGLHEATLRTIKKHETDIGKFVYSLTKLSDKSSSYTRDIVRLMTGWWQVFLKDKASHNIKIKSEDASADELVTKEFQQILAKMIEDWG